jgi:hypothetical protein
MVRSVEEILKSEGCSHPRPVRRHRQLHHPRHAGDQNQPPPAEIPRRTPLQ